MLPTTTYSSPSSTPTPLLPPSEPLSEPSLPPSIPESRLKPTTSRCTGYFWNLACENTPSRAQGGCLPCNQGFSVNFNLLRIRDRVDHTSYKNFTYISSKELAIKFMTTEEAESQSEQDLKLKPYQSPYGRMGEEIFVYCGAKCNKITLKNPEPSLPKRRVGCCLWTLQRRGQGRPLLIKQSDERRSPPPPDEVMTNPFTTLPETAPPFSFSNRENTFSMTARVSNIFFSSHSSSSTNTSTLPASHTTPSPSLLPLFSATTQSDLFSYSEPVLATGGNPETSNLPNPLSSSSTSALTATTRNAFLDEPSSPHSKGAAKLDPKRICIGNFWNLDCKIIAKKPLRCGSCDQGFPVNFNLLRITDTLNHTQDKKITSISSTEFAIKFNTPEEAEAESQTNPNLKAYQSPYGRTGEEIFVFCASACRKIVLKNPDRFIHKHKAGCCLWTMQKRGQKLLIKQSNQKPAPPSSVEVEANSSTARPEVPPLFSFSHTEDALSRTAKASNHIFSLSSLSLENTSTPPPSQTPSTPSLFPFLHRPSTQVYPRLP